MAGARSENGNRDRRHPITGPSSFTVSSTEWSLRAESQAQPARSMIYSRGNKKGRPPAESCLFGFGTPATAQAGCLLRCLALPEMVGLTGNHSLGTGKPENTSQRKVMFSSLELQTTPTCHSFLPGRGPVLVPAEFCLTPMPTSPGGRISLQSKGCSPGDIWLNQDNQDPACKHH